MSTNRKSFDQQTNSRNQFLTEMHGDQSGEFVWILGLKWLCANRPFSNDVTSAILVSQNNTENGGHVGVLNQSCGRWTFFFFLFWRQLSTIRKGHIQFGRRRVLIAKSSEKPQVRTELTALRVLVYFDLTTEPLETLWRARFEFNCNYTSHRGLYRGLARNRPSNSIRDQDCTI